MSIRSEYRKVLALGAVTGIALPLLAAPAAASPPGDWPALPPEAPQSAPVSSSKPDVSVRKVVRESRAMSGKIYEVRPGDTLWTIAERTFGDASRWPELFEANRSRLVSPHKLTISQKLELGTVAIASRGGSRQAKVTASGKTYTVRPGDTLGKIARREFGRASKWPVLYALNRERLPNPHQLWPGQVITLSAERQHTVVVSPRATVKPSGRKISRSKDDGRLLKGHRRVDGSYYARGHQGQLVWADTHEPVRPNDSTLKTKLAPKIREAFKVPEPKPVAAKKPAKKAPAHAVHHPGHADTTTYAAAPKTAAAPRAMKVLIELPEAQKPAVIPASSRDRLSAGAMSLVVPGAGQLYNGDVPRAALFMGAGAAGLGAAVYGIANDRQDIGMAASAGLVALTLWSATDAYLNAPSRPAR